MKRSKKYCSATITLLRESFSHLQRPLDNLQAVYRILRTARLSRSVIDFHASEPEFIYDSEGKIETIKARDRLESHRLIEECMIVANICAAKYIGRHKLPALYRVHDHPSAERLGKLIDFLGKRGINGRAHWITLPRRNFPNYWHNALTAPISRK